MSTSRISRVGIIGAGYIAEWHAAALGRVPGVELAAVCDVNLSAAEEFARPRGVPAFAGLSEMATSGQIDAVHILTPPHTHATLAVEALEAGLHVLVEKPAALSVAGVEKMSNAAASAGRALAVGHNFLALPSYERLKAARDSGRLGRIASAEINWRFPLQPLRTGPFNLWMMRETPNLLLELGPHLFAFAHDLFGPVEVTHLETSHPIELPGGGTRPQVWRILGRAGGVDLTFHLSLLEGLDDRSVTLRGAAGMARLDYAADTSVLTLENASDIVLNPLRNELSQVGQHAGEGFRNAARQLRTLNRDSPFGLSLRRTCAAFYSAVNAGQPVDPRFSAETARGVIGSIEDVLERLPPEEALPAPMVPKSAPSAMVIGGTGFVGRALVRALVADGRTVRVLSRGSFGPFGDIADKVETVAVSLRDEAALAKAMEGLDVVYNLAKSTDASWEDALANDVAVAEGIGRATLKAGAGRLVYSGTIACYDMSDRAKEISEDTGFGDMSERNIYARSKAECERRLEVLSSEQGLPLVIARPGIVLGATGPLQHWGIGRWHGAGAVRIWGDGRNTLPLVLNDDVADGLLRMATNDQALGESFNLVGEPMFSARDYFDAIHDVHGTRIRVASGSLLALHTSSFGKYLLKRYALGRQDSIRTSLADMKSRAHLSKFTNEKAKNVLGWRPETDRERFVTRAIDEANLFGF